jgi:hypothetical protein
MGFLSAYRGWRDGRNVSEEVKRTVSALLEAVKLRRGPGRGVDLRLSDGVEMLAVREILTSHAELTVMQFSGSMQLCYRVDQDAAIGATTRAELKAHGFMKDPDSIVIPD